MYRFKIAIFVCLSIVLQACSAEKSGNFELIVDFVNINIINDLRGLSVVNENVLWASGSHGVFLISKDGGESWLIDSVAGAGNLDFRSIEAFDENTAIVVSAGTPANIYLTEDGGKNWELTWSDSNPAVFLDAVAFRNPVEGLVAGDPVDGCLLILKTADGGNSWKRIDPGKIPQSLNTEGGFAASGTCLAMAGEKSAWIGTGGDLARVYYSVDAGLSWFVVNTPILSGSPMKGIYSLSFKNESIGIAVGGEWNVKNPIRSKAFTLDGGKSWALGSGSDTYCSGSCYVKDDIFLACGQSGIDITANGGQTWEHLSDLHLYGLQFDPTGSKGFGTGPSGRIVKLKLRKNKAGWFLSE